MCLTIPKKVVEIGENSVIVESHDGDRQEMKTIVELTIGDFVMTQQNVVVEKMDKEIAEEIFKIINERN
jgi:hydrogenase maturation factor